ncbi:hypothetical protein AX14_007635 [Amanita brunnescens Koide BX004]|nr:hypothetical protein AX14_007635 [Amanita brunnescens Koide BX004]
MRLQTTTTSLFLTRLQVASSAKMIAQVSGFSKANVFIRNGSQARTIEDAVGWIKQRRQDNDHNDKDCEGSRPPYPRSGCCIRTKRIRTGCQNIVGSPHNLSIDGEVKIKIGGVVQIENCAEPFVVRFYDTSLYVASCNDILLVRMQTAGRGSPNKPDPIRFRFNPLLTSAHLAE